MVRNMDSDSDDADSSDDSNDSSDTSDEHPAKTFYNKTINVMTQLPPKILKWAALPTTTTCNGKLRVGKIQVIIRGSY